MFKILQLFLAISLGLFANESSAQLFKINVTNYGFNTATNPALKTLVDSQIAQVETDVNKGLPSTNPDRLMEGMANSSVMAGKGIGTDYASNMSVFLIGAGVGAAADLTKDKSTGGDISGAGVAPGAVIGFNLGFLDAENILGLDTNRLNMYVNFMNYNYNAVLNKSVDKKSEADLKMESLGVHFRYDAVKGNGTKFLGWGGIKFTWGYEYNKTSTTFTSTISEKVNQNGLSGTITGKPSAQIDSATHSIPLAISTDIQIFYLLSLYTGIGADANFGKAKAKGSLNGDKSNINCSSGAACTAAGNPTIQVQPSANINGSANVTPFTFRGFAGVQINLPWTRIFAEVDKGLGNNMLGATAGVRFVF
jgi:hypothetical protein